MANSVRVLSYNIHQGVGMDGRYELRRVAHAIERIEPDLLALQEVDRFRERTDFDDQFERLEALLGLDGRFGRAATMSEESTGEGKPQLGMGVFSRHPITDTTTYDLPVVNDRQERILFETRVDVDGTELTFCTTHLGISEADRKEQVSTLLDLVGDRSGNFLLVGDFNASHKGYLIQPFMERFRDVFAEQGKDEAYTFSTPFVEHGEGKKHLEVYAPTRREDYIFTTDAVEIDHCDRRFSLGSDHLPIIADLTVSE